MQIEQNRPLTADIFQLELSGSDFRYKEVQPGQFVNVLIGEGKAHPLRRPLSIAACDPLLGRLTLVYRVVGAGTAWLSKQRTGAEIDVLGPLGRGFPQPSSTGAILVVGGGVGIPPLYQLVRELSAEQGELDIVLGFKDKADVFWVDQFREWGPVTVCTEDGSLGERGFVTDCLPDGQWATLYACGPRPMLKALKACFNGQDIAGYISLEERMACGIGACLGCVCQSGMGSVPKRICKDGPVFAWEEVIL